MYGGLYEAEVARVLKTFLKEGDTFIDVGANIGYITALGAGYVGEKGEVHSFEPVPEYFKELQKVAAMNKRFKIKVNQVALGGEGEEKRDKLYIGGRARLGRNTFIPALLRGARAVRVIEAPMQRLDKYLREEGVAKISLIKIDVEGFEFPVLKGSEEYLSRKSGEGCRPLILCELLPSAYPFLGHSLQDLLDYMKKLSYYPFKPLKPGRRLRVKEIRERPGLNVLFKAC